MIGRENKRDDRAERLDRRLVLVVDDDPAFRRDLCQALEDAGHETMAASNGREAMGCLLFSRRKPHVIVLDLVMAGLNGKDFLGWKRAQPVYSRIPVIVVSGSDEIASLVEGRDASVLLPKPFLPGELLDAVRSHAAG